MGGHDNDNEQFYGKLKIEVWQHTISNPSLGGMHKSLLHDLGFEFFPKYSHLG